MASMNNQDMGDLFDSLADLLEIKGENPFKIRAFRRASEVVSELTDDVAELAESLRHETDAAKFNAAADKLKASYAQELLNPASGLIAGWKSADGQLHDYDFTFPTGLAVSLGLVEGEAARGLMQTLWARFKAKVQAGQIGNEGLSTLGFRVLRTERWMRNGAAQEHVLHHHVEW